MFDYLQKYQQVPAEVRAKLDSATTKAAIDNLEETYHLSLASIIIKLVIKEIPLSRLALYLAENNNLNHDQANKLATEIQINVLSVINDYLSKPLSAPIDINRLAKTNPVTLLPNTATPVKPSKKPLDLENILNKLVSQQQYIRQTGQLNRLRQAIKTFLIGVRNQKALEDYLTKSFDLGGLGLSLEQSNNLVAQIIQAKDLYESENKKKLVIQPPVKPTDKLIATAAVHDFESELIASLRKIDNQPKTDLKTETELPAANIPEKKLIKAPEEDLKLTPPLKESTPAPAPVPAPAPAPAPAKEKTTVVIPLDQRPTDNKTGKIRMDDVKFTPKTLTPIDELATLTLKKFRYLGSSAEDRANKIKEKLNLLSEYGYSKKLEGVNAWRQSPLNRLYLEIGQDSIRLGKTAEELLKNNLDSNSENLTFTEFIAIMNLNKEIRF